MVLAALLITVVSVFILSDLFHGIAHFLSNRDMDIHFNAVFAARDLITALFILSGIFVIKTVYDRQAYILENERLTRENLLGQFESLKNQLSPHFLFNSLSALKSLILENPENAQRYIDHLSRVLRYSLKSKGENTVTLAEELEELNSYLYLVKMRYEDSIRIDTDIPEKYLRHRIPRLALQTLVENAVKHNVISKRHPLLIHTFVKDHRVHVSNTRREKQKAEAGNGIGLANLMSQYRMLNSRDILIERTSDEFKVALPLLKRDTDESSHS